MGEEVGEREETYTDRNTAIYNKEKSTNKLTESIS